MKKLLTKVAAACLLAACTQTANAQFYAGLNVGYGFGTTSDLLGTNQTYDTGNRLTSSKAIRGTLAGGLPLQLNLGYFINEHVRFDLGVTYFMGSETTASQSTRTNQTFKQTAKTTQIRLNPSVIVQMGHGKVQPYTRFGLVLPVGGKTVGTQLIDVTSPVTSKTTIMTESKGAMSLGFEAGFGAAYMINDNIGITGELSYIGLRIKAAEMEITKYETVTNGVTQDALAQPTFTTYAKKTVYQDELTSASNNPSTVTTVVDQSKPKNDIASSTNFSNLAIRVGVFYKLGGGKKE